MRTWISIIFILSAIYLLAGGGYSSIISDRQIEASVNAAREGAGKLYDEAREIASETKERLRERLSSELETVRSEIEELSGQVGEVSGVEKDVLVSRLDRLKDKEKRITGKLRKIEYTDVSYWAEIKKRYNTIAGGVRTAWQVVAGWMADKEGSIKISL